MTTTGYRDPPLRVSKSDCPAGKLLPTISPRAPGIPGFPMEDGGSRNEMEVNDEDWSQSVTAKKAQPIHPARPCLGVLVCIALAAVGGVVFMFTAAQPSWALRVLVLTLMGILILLGGSVWCMMSDQVWKLSVDCCSHCDFMDVATQEDPMDAIKLCCCAISCTGPAVIMGGSIILLWVLKAYAAAATLTCFLMSLIIVVVYLDIRAAIRCVECLQFQCSRVEGCGIFVLVKYFVALGASLGFWRLLLVISLSMCFNVGSLVMGWAILTSFETLWNSGFGFIPVGLIIFIIPLLAVCLCLNILVLLGCGSTLVRCWRTKWLGKGANLPWVDSVYDADSGQASFAESEGIQITPPIHVVVA